MRARGGGGLKPLSSPPGFQGAFHTDRASRRSAGRAAGPYRMLPAAVAVPRSAEDLSTLIRHAGRECLGLVPRGAGTGMPGGNVGPGVAVELKPSFGRIGEIDEGGRIRVGAGAVAGDVARRARERGFFLPALPSSAHRCTLGGMAANNAAGARSFKYDSLRPWIREMECVLADGRVVRLRRGEVGPTPFPELGDELRVLWPSLETTWPRVRKNSSGYALDHFVESGDPIDLVVGSEGTLAFVTELRLQLLPEPAAKLLVLAALPDAESLVAAVGAAREVEASACEFFGRRFLDLADLSDHPEAARLAPDSYALILLELDGDPEGVEERCAHLRRLLGTGDASLHVARDRQERRALWSVRHAASPTIEEITEGGRRSLQFIEDSVVPPDRLGAYLTGLDEILGHADLDAVVFGHAGDGNVHVNPIVDVTRPGWKNRVRETLEATVDLVASLGGTLSGEHGDGRIRAPYVERIWGPGAVDAFRTVKERLDPDRILNPGVILPEPRIDPLDCLEPRT